LLFGISCAYLFVMGGGELEVAAVISPRPAPPPRPHGPAWNYTQPAWPANNSQQPRPDCPATPANLVGRLVVIQEERSWAEMEAELGEVVRGGQYQPPACRPRHSVAIIVPLRDREAHLKIFLYFLHPILMRQNLHYRIFVISQDDKLTFNRAMLFNVGFVEAAKLEDWDCYVFHDVDLLPEDDRNIYSCPDQPRHMSVAVDKFHYKLPYKVANQ